MPVVKEPVPVVDQTVHVAMMFTDMVKSSRYVNNRRDPGTDYDGAKHSIIEQSIAFCQALLDDLTIRYQGDCIVAVHPDGQVLAELALFIRDLHVTTDWKSLGFDQSVAVRIGLHAGKVSDNGKIGQPDRYYGGAMNIGARIEPITLPNQVWVSAAFHNAFLKTPIRTMDTMPLGAFALPKGAGQESLYRLRWAQPDDRAENRQQETKAVLEDLTKNDVPGLGLFKEKTEHARAAAGDFDKILSQFWIWIQEYSTALSGFDAETVEKTAVICEWAIRLNGSQLSVQLFRNDSEQTPLAMTCRSQLGEVFVVIGRQNGFYGIATVIGGQHLSSEVQNQLGAGGAYALDELIEVLWGVFVDLLGRSEGD